MPRQRWVLAVFALASLATLDAQPAATSQPADPTPQTIDEFRATAARILHETRVPGAGIALVRAAGVEWEGGLGYADRDRQIPVTADTHFRVGSISKTFVAMSLVQLSEDGVVGLDDPVKGVVPEIAIDNPWHDTDPVRVIHLLQHTAGFDDMHFNERYAPAGAPELPLLDVLKVNPHSRRVRWRPGTRMSYSNPGYAVAGYLLEKLSGVPYEQYIKREIFQPLGMTTSSFILTEDDEKLLAQGYGGPEGSAVGYPAIYLRPAGNMHSSARELGRFVRMLLNWGELDKALVVDPEYLGTMETPQTTLASAAGLRFGYGTGIFTTLSLPYRVLGHSGGIDGFSSSYAYSPSRDVGFVVLLNATGSGAQDAQKRLQSLAIRFLKRDLEPPARPEIQMETSALDGETGYYHDANPRNQFAWPIQSLLSGRTITRDGGYLYVQPLLGARERLVPAAHGAMFRRDDEADASRVFTSDASGTRVLAGTDVYAERRPRWRVELVRLPVLAAIPLISSVFAVAVVWVARIRWARPRGFWDLKLALLLAPIVLVIPFGALALTPSGNWGTRNAATVAVFLATLALPALATVVAALAVAARVDGASRWLVGYAIAIASALGVLSIYLGAHGMLGLRLWSY